MAPDEVATTLYLEHLTERDLAFLCGPGRGGTLGGDPRGLVRNRRGGIEGFLADREVFDALFGTGQSGQVMVVSPFLAFAVAVRWAAHELGSAAFVPEWSGAGRRAPVFDVPRLREFVSDPVRRFFLAELLASYARVASGSLLVATRRGLRRRRFSELDPVQLAGLLEVVPKAERPGVLRRLGDLALFLTGVFPDYVARRGFGPVDQGRLLRAAVGWGETRQGVATRPVRVGDDDAVALLAQLGRRWYQAASRLLPSPLPANVAVIGEMPERFNDARRVLSVVAERFLFPQRERWFGFPPA